MRRSTTAAVAAAAARGGSAASAENLRNSNWNRLIGPEFLDAGVQVGA